jgi:hypothetical protein
VNKNVDADFLALPLAAGSYKFEVLEFSAEDGSLFAMGDKNFVIG